MLWGTPAGALSDKNPTRGSGRAQFSPRHPDGWRAAGAHRLSAGEFCGNRPARDGAVARAAPLEADVARPRPPCERAAGTSCSLARWSRRRQHEARPSHCQVARTRSLRESAAPTVVSARACTDRGGDRHPSLQMRAGGAGNGAGGGPRLSRGARKEGRCTARCGSLSVGTRGACCRAPCCRGAPHIWGFTPHERLCWSRVSRVLMS